MIFRNIYFFIISILLSFLFPNSKVTYGVIEHLSFNSNIIGERKIEIIGLSVDEGIANYRSESLDCAARECKKLGIELEIFSYKELIGVTLGELLIEKPPRGSPCSPCGILRRRSLNQMANRSNVDCLILGHNLDDFAQTILMNHARGDIARLSRMAPHKFVQKGSPIFTCTTAPSLKNVAGLFFVLSIN